ncbi:MAG: EAL domain-containing protein [Oscillospiraceae bacterium]
MNFVSYDIEYEYAAMALIGVLLVLYLARRRYPGLTNQLFVGMMLCTFLSALTHVLAIRILPVAYNYSAFVNYFIRILYLWSYNFDAVLFMLYVSALTNKNKLSGQSRIIAVSVTALELVLLITTPFTKLMIYFDEDMNYHHGALFHLLLGIAILLLAYDTALLICYRRKLNMLQKTAVVMFEILTVFATLLQLFIRSLAIGNLAIALSLVMFIIVLQNPDDFTDKGTGCYNDDAFFLSVGDRIDKKKPFTIAAFRFDGLNYISGLFQVGDRDCIAKAISARLKSEFRTDEIYHLGNCEFAMFTNERRRITEKYLTDRLLRQFKRPVLVHGTEAIITPRICLVRYPDFATSAEDVRDAIEFTLNNSKKEEGSVFVATTDAMTAKKREVRILGTIKKSIVARSFEMYYQPIYDTAENGFISAEALIRMKDSKLGFVSPEEFIPLAEANGMIIEIGEIAFRKVCEFLKSGRAQKLGVRYIEVNLSAVQCMQEQLADTLMAIMKEYGIPPEQINFEITETAGLANYDVLLKNMNRLLSHGVTFSMDDYGTGFSTANYLISLPVDIVKIDKSILWPAMKNREALVILWHTVEMLRTLSKKIVVEGVETNEMAQMLIDMGCDHLQGYYYQKPVPEEEYISFLEKNRHAEEKSEKILKNT